MAFFEINATLCKKDNICTKLCPAGTIKLGELGYPYVEEGDADKCIACGQCVTFCPFDACSVASVPKAAPVDKAALPSAEQATLLLKSRRSIRMFKKNGLERATVQMLLEVANMAPAAKNNRYLRWIVLEERQMLRKAADLVIAYFTELSKTMKETQPKTAAVMKVLIKSYQAGKDVIFRDAPQLILAVAPMEYAWKVEDGVIALTYLELAAHAHGAGTCWGGYLTDAARNYQPLREYLGIAEDEYTCGAQMIGYPALGIARKIPDRAAVKVEFLP